jgi:membrane carboxypeptidase/penicillin-binding protein PbpC
MKAWAGLLARIVGASLLVLGFTFWLLDYFFPFEVSPAYAQIVYDRQGNILHTFLSSDQNGVSRPN